MQIQSQARQQQGNNQKITLKLSEGTSFGKPYQKRELEPSMFELLQWNNCSLTKHDFKKNRDFRDVPQAYLGQINKTEWKSECKQNYIIPNGNIEVDQSNLYRVEKYIHSKESKNTKNTKKLNQKQADCVKEHEVKDTKAQNPNNKKNNKANLLNASQSKKLIAIQSKNANRPKSQSNERKNQNKRPTSSRQTFTNKKGSVSNKNAFGFNDNQNLNLSVDKQIKQRKKLIEDFKNTTRWIPNSAFTTYFGKPAFQNYGRNNTNPSKGGLIYGTYLYSHNVQPHRGLNSPKSLQSYPVALSKAQSKGTLVPFPPKTKNPNLSNSSQADKSAEKFSGVNIYPQANNIQGLNIQKPNLMDIQRFGGTGIQRTTVYKTTQNVQQSIALSDKDTEKPIKSKK